MQFVKQSVIRATPERVFHFHEQPEALSFLTPPWEKAHVVHAANISQLGSRAVVEIDVFGLFRKKWIAEHTVYQPPNLFEDIQIEGPFKSWRHRHVVEPHSDGAVLRDEISYEPPFGLLGRLVAPVLIDSRLEKLFNFRHEVTRRWCETNQDSLKV